MTASVVQLVRKDDEHALRPGEVAIKDWHAIDEACAVSCALAEYWLGQFPAERLGELYERAIAVRKALLGDAA